LGFQGACGAYLGEMQLPEEFGYFSKLQLTQDVSAVSGHCFVFKKTQWQEVGGFDTDKFAIRYSVLDFCLKLNKLGYRHVWAPTANAMHHGGRSLQKRMNDFEFKVSFVQKDVSEKNNLIKLWGKELANDKKNIYWLITLDKDDVTVTPELIKEIQLLLNGYIYEIKLSFSKSKIDAINRDVNECSFNWDVLVNISDDQVPIRVGWDEIIRHYMPDNLDASLWFNDGNQDRINTQEIIGKTYYKRFNYIY
jgi:hypothetical protein